MVILEPTQTAVVNESLSNVVSVIIYKGNFQTDKLEGLKESGSIVSGGISSVALCAKNAGINLLLQN